MKRIMIGADVAYASGATSMNDINVLAAGAFAFFTENGRILTAANANTVLNAQPDTKKVYLAMGSGVAATGALMSVHMDRMSANVVKTAYVAPVAQIQVIGNDGAVGALNFPSPLVVGDSAIIRFTDTSAGTQPPANVKAYEYVVRNGDTDADIVAALVAAVNADADAFVTLADLSGAGISVTTDAFDMKVEISLDGIISDADIIDEATSNVVAVDMVIGVGTPAKMSALELEMSAVEGNTNRIYQSGFWYTRATDVSSSETYDVYVIQYDNVKVGATTNTLATRGELIVAMPTGGAGQADFETVLTQIFGEGRIEVETVI